MFEKTFLKFCSKYLVSILGIFSLLPGVYLNALMCVAEPQGISWEIPVEGTGKGESLTEPDLGGEQRQVQQEVQVQLKLTIEDFVLHKMLGKGSFGKVSVKRLQSHCIGVHITCYDIK